MNRSYGDVSRLATDNIRQLPRNVTNELLRIRDKINTLIGRIFE